jgi:hypothetical protein
MQSYNFLTLNELRWRIKHNTIGWVESYTDRISAVRVHSRKYKPGQIVYNVDPKWPMGEKMVFISSLRWDGGAGYIVIRVKNHSITTTTNISNRPKGKNWILRWRR